MLLNYLLTLQFFPPFGKDKKTLAQIVHIGKKAHAAEQGDIVTGTDRRGGEQPMHHFHGQVIGKKIAGGNVEDELEDHAERVLIVLKGVVFVEKIAEGTANDIVGGRREPITEPQYNMR